MKIIFNTLLVTIFLPLACFAKLAETTDQLDTRHGKPFAVDGNILIYKDEKFTFIYWMKNNEAVATTISVGTNKKLTDAEILSFLAENSNGLGFKLNKSESSEVSNRYYTEAESGRMGEYNISNGILTICTKDGLDVVNATTPKEVVPSWISK
jgi:hypothetical protein